MTDVPSQLTWDVYVTAEEPIVTDDLPPGATERRWPPISATLISAGRDAVLVDPLMTAGQARGLGDWIAASGEEPDGRLRHAWPRRPLVRPERDPGSLPRVPGVRRSRRRRTDAPLVHPGVPSGLLESSAARQALEAVGLDDSFKRIVHFSSFSLLARRGQAASDSHTCWLFRRISLLARKSSRACRCVGVGSGGCRTVCPRPGRGRGW